MVNTPPRAGTVTRFAFADCLLGSASLLITAESQKEGSGYCCIGAVLLSAFAVEATLNHIGEIANPSWDDPPVSWETKLQSLEGVFTFQVDRSRRPFQSVKELLMFRDMMAHGRTITTTIKEGSGDPWAKWILLCIGGSRRWMRQMRLLGCS